MTDDEIMEIRKDFPTDEFGGFDLLAFAREILKASKDELAGKLITVWYEYHGKQISWDKAIEICVIVGGLSEEERNKLLAFGS